MQEVLVMLEAKSAVMQDDVGQLLAQMAAARQKCKRKSKKVSHSLLVCLCDGIHDIMSTYSRLLYATGLWAAVQRSAMVVLLLRPRYATASQLLCLKY